MTRRWVRALGLRFASDVTGAMLVERTIAKSLLGI